MHRVVSVRDSSRSTSSRVLGRGSSRGSLTIYPTDWTTVSTHSSNPLNISNLVPDGRVSQEGRQPNDWARVLFFSMDYNRDVSLKKGGGQWKKRRDFLPPNKTKMSFMFLIDFVGARMTWQKRIGQEHFRRIADAWRDVSVITCIYNMNSYLN